MGVDHCGFSPRVRQKIVHAGVNSGSYQQASRDLAELSDLDVKPKPVERLVKTIGRERIDRRDAAVESHRKLPLMAKDAVAHPERPCRRVAMVSIDGGRIQIRADPSRPERDGHWKESKVAVLETYQSAVHEADPDPHVPRCFLDLKRTKEMVRGLGHSLPVGLEFEEYRYRDSMFPTSREPVRFLVRGPASCSERRPSVSPGTSRPSMSKGSRFTLGCGMIGTPGPLVRDGRARPAVVIRGRFQDMSEIVADSEDRGSDRARTIIGQFLAHRGVIIIKETREIGVLKCEQGKKVAAETLTLATAKGSRKMLGKTFGIRLEAPLDHGGTRSAVLDFEEAEEFCNAIHFLYEAAQRLAPLKTDHTEATFSTKDMIQVGFYQSTEQQQLAFVQLGDRGDFCFFQIASLLSLKKLIEAARSYLVIKGAGPAPADLSGDQA